MAYVVADGALYSEANLQKLAYVPMKMLTRVPATFGEGAHSNYLPYDIG
jgi:transposase